MGTSLKDIAIKLGLSKTTVSWVLSGKGDERNISRDTQKKVFQCAKELSYVPNGLARSLNTGYSRTLGLIIPSISDSFYSTIANKIEEEACKAGYALMIASSNSDQETEDNIIKVYEEKQIDGLIIAPTKLSLRGIERLVSKKIPLVLIDRYYPDMDISYVVIDNEEASYELVRRMYRSGCRKVALVTTNSYLLTMSMRARGYEQAVRDSGFELNRDLFCEVPIVGYQEHIQPLLADLFDNVPDIDGVFFTSHILLIEALKFFQGRGIDLSDGKLSLASMRSEPLLRILAPRLNVAHFPEEEMGENAVRMVLEQIDSRKSGIVSPAESVILKCDLDFVY